ncbi:Fe-S oxidoreductase, partial [Streptomyces sp. NRRL WC-3753]
MRIGLFATCLGDTLYPDAVKSTAVLLARLGHEVVFPPGQTCCGQMHVNTGYQREPVPLVRNYAEQFGDASIEAVVMPSGSCAGSVRHQHEIIAERYGDAALRSGVATVK